jgi:DNA-directed RNA polymerase specialized sigma24 family protein
MFTPFAVEVYRRYLSGKTIEELSRELGIPRERIEDRIRAAEAYVSRQAKAA